MNRIWSLLDIERNPRRMFAAVQAGKGLVGAALAMGFLLVVGRPDPFETAALAGLLAPLLLALAAATRLPLPLLEQAGLALFALLIGYLAALTGGLQSPLTVWLFLVPAEAALAGGTRPVMKAGISAAIVLAALAGVTLSGDLPPSRLPAPTDAISAAILFAGLLQMGLIAVAARDQKRAADRAAEQGTAMYQLLADNAVDLITRHAPDGRISFASPAAAALLGRKPEELEGVLPAALAHPEDLSALQAAFLESAYFGREGAAEVRLRHGGQGYVWTEIRCRPAGPRVKGAPAGIVAVTRDITERKAQERALIEARDVAMSASRAKSAFLANMSHELRTPLNAIIGFSELMEREIFGPLGNARYQEYARLIHDSGGHLLELINGVLDMSKIEAGKFELYEEIFPLDEVAQAALRFVHLAAERGGVALSSEIAPGTRQIFADKRAVKQILVNLLSNGVKFTPRGGRVVLSARRVEKGVEIAVRDTGTGISRADLEKLGKPFEQAEGAMTRGKEGTGLGLALVKSLAAMHGGEAVLESELGVGTIVRIRLPFAAVDEDGAARPKAEAKVLPFRGAA
ncbi:MAG: PAS domain-containing sensor histidine kinase [Alphaproteobacteria bacterium]|nr:PAS domain-containing sensor histidine kinase [Alphaproteobacteria bacterium]